MRCPVCRRILFDTPHAIDAHWRRVGHPADERPAFPLGSNATDTSHADARAYSRERSLAARDIRALNKAGDLKGAAGHLRPEPQGYQHRAQTLADRERALWDLERRG